MSQSTPETKARYAFLKAKKIGEVWQDGPYIYRKGANGITVVNADSLLATAWTAGRP